MRLASPPGYDTDPLELDRVRAFGGAIELFDRPEAAVRGADAVYTDVWASMGQEAEAEARRRAFEGFTVDGLLMSDASPDAVFLHCLPAHRGEEVSEEVLEGNQSRVWDQAENRLHVQKALMAMLMGNSVSGTKKSVSGKEKASAGKRAGGKDRVGRRSRKRM
jgi:ornithine carbamoyltransferase